MYCNSFNFLPELFWILKVTTEAILIIVGFCVTSFSLAHISQLPVYTSQSTLALVRQNIDHALSLPCFTLDHNLFIKMNKSFFVSFGSFNERTKKDSFIFHNH